MGDIFRAKEAKTGNAYISAAARATQTRCYLLPTRRARVRTRLEKYLVGVFEGRRCSGLTTRPMLRGVW